MRLVWVGDDDEVWDVLAIEHRPGHSVWTELEDADPSDGGAEQMRATLKTSVPLNGPRTMNKRKCRDLGGGVYEFKESGVRVLWFYDVGEPVTRRRIICTHSTPKVSTKEFQPEIARARRFRGEYIDSKLSKTLIILPKKKKPEKQ